ncbi:HvfA family oxazolone/thioamide-modified RiPP metallophore [Dechloromonas agitata]
MRQADKKVDSKCGEARCGADMNQGQRALADLRGGDMMLVCWMGGEAITGRWPSCGGLPPSGRADGR